MPKKTKVDIPIMQKTEEMDVYYLDSLKKCFPIPQFHNVKFLVGEEAKEFKCNGTVLAVISPVFRDLLLLSKQKTATPVKLPNITPVGFSALVRFGFSFDPEIGPDNLIDVIHAAKEFKVYIVYDLALNYLVSILESYAEEYFVPYLELANKYHLREVVQKCIDNLHRLGGVKKFLKSKTFTEFSAEFVNLLLSCDELPVQEAYVWECVQAWAKVQARKQKKDLVDLLRTVYHSVRFPLMTTKYFSAHVVPVGMLSQKEMLDLFCYLTYPEGKPTTLPFSSVPRMLWENVCIQRYSKCGGDWFHLNGYVDCIGIESDRKCQILAVGVFIGEGLTKCGVKIFKGQGELRELLEDTGDVDISTEEKSKEPVRMNFPAPVTLLPGVVHEIEIDQTGPTSWKLKDGKTNVTHTCNDLEINFLWHKPKVETETTLKKGNIPCIWVRVQSGE